MLMKTAIYEWGDNGKDFSLINNTSVNFQVKTTCFSRILQKDKDIDYEVDEQEYFTDLYEDYLRIDHDKCKKIIDTVKWKISEKELNKNQIFIFVLLLNRVIGDTIAQEIDVTKIDKYLIPNLIVMNFSPPEVDVSYSSILCGFKPTDLLKPDTDIYLKDLFYIGGLKGYLKHFT